MDTIRSFIAVGLNETIKNEISRIQDILKKSEADVKWVRKENLHITLKFLGQIQEGKIEKISKLMAERLSSFKPFSLRIEQLGAFPKISYPRVIWINTISADNALEKLADSTETALVSLGFAKEKRSFKSHITLGRTRTNRNKGRLAELLQKTTAQSKEMLVEEVSLFKSTLSSLGPRYESLFTINFKL